MTSTDLSARHHAATQLLEEVRGLPAEDECVEFKENQPDADRIGKNISALANAAVLAERPFGYMVWGVRDSDQAIVGTTFNPFTTYVSRQPLELWIRSLVRPDVDFRFHELILDEKRVILLNIPAAVAAPVQFKDQRWIRIGSATTNLKDHVEHERRLWQMVSRDRVEDRYVIDGLTIDELGACIDTDGFPALFNLPRAETDSGLLDQLSAHGLARIDDAGQCSVSLAGLLILGTDLTSVRATEKKTVRIIEYRGDDRTEATGDDTFVAGYATGFETLIEWVMRRLPYREEYSGGRRRTERILPELAVREITANALVHQDLLVTGAGPTIEIFPRRLEVTNPGRSLIEPNRLLDTPPQSRNPLLARLLRQAGLCEERGSGIDRVVKALEDLQLPAPLFETRSNSTMVTLYAGLPFAEMEREARLRACYLHASLEFVQARHLTNASLRKRFGLGEEARSQTSRLINDAVETGLLKAQNPGSNSRRHARYVPYWA